MVFDASKSSKIPAKPQKKKNHKDLKFAAYPKEQFSNQVIFECFAPWRNRS
jgi:hypothetical protein